MTISHIIDEQAYENGTRRAIIRNAQITFEKNTDNLAAINWLAGNAHKGGFAKSLLDGYNQFGKLTEKQVAAVLNIIAKDGARRAEWKAANVAASRHIGNVGDKKVVFTCKLVKLLEIETSFGYMTINILKTDDGATVIYKGNTWLGDEGDTAHFTATIKAHDERDGIKQTVVLRPKLITAP